MNHKPNTEKYCLPTKVESLLATLSSIYARKHEDLLQRIVVNATYSVDACYDYDNWDGGQTGHLVHLALPTPIFLDTIDTLTEIERRLADDLNTIAKCPHEHFSAVSVEQTNAGAYRLWREKSGALLTLHKSEQEMSAAEERLWIKDYVRVFLSHKAEHKKTASDLKLRLKSLGVSAFVAHEDIEPTKEWLEEIEFALSTQEVCVALMTEGFRDSKWTDQEIGISIGRGVDVVTVRLGEDPYGFIGKFQAVSGKDKTIEKLAGELVNLLLGNPRLQSRMKTAIVAAFENSDSYEMANALMHHIKELPSLRLELVSRLEKAFEHNPKVKNAYTVQYLLQGVIQRLKAEASSETP